VVLGVLAKMPILGQVKTRLAQGIGDEAALRVYKSLLSHTYSEVLASKIPSYWFWEPGLLGSMESPSLYPMTHSLGQGDGDLGDRLERAATQLLSLPNSGILLIGADCPLLTKKILLEAQEALTTHDAVLGPAEDGGYYLIGFKETLNSLFKNIPWSTDQVSNLTRLALENAQRNYLSLELLTDIDTPTDWDRFRNLDLFQGIH
jgi:rSAM/selenodomain-associated transferase 1